MSNETPMPSPETVTQEDDIRNLAHLIRELQRAADRAVRRHRIANDAFHPLNVLNIGLFNLSVIGKLAADASDKAKDEV